MNLDDSAQLCRLFGDGSRVRILRLLEIEPLTVAELTQIIELAQSRISTHLARLRDVSLVSDRKQGNSSLYFATPEASTPLLRELWNSLRRNLDDRQLAQDEEKARELIRSRQPAARWADSVAGRMESQYSPGRTWETTTRAITSLVSLGDVIDIASGDGVLAELLHARAKRINCVDFSPVVIEAGRSRLQHCSTVRFALGDMHALPFADATHDVAFLLHALVYTQDPARVLREAARVLRPGGRLICTTLNSHSHQESVAAYDHVTLGVSVEQLQHWLKDSGLHIESCAITSRETRPPYFEVITALAVK